jgi:hypothetical protein|tara:strand:+ start:62 stop:517 length:456 start_codon:yes stop_codon:yes gene_type:complete
MSLIKTLSLIIFLNIFICSVSFAQTTTSTTGKFTILNKGSTAPFAGTLFDPVATAKILAEKEIQRKLCESRSKYEKDIINATCKRETDLLRSALEIEKRKNNLIVSAQQEEIETLRNLAKGSDNTFWTAIGFAAGAATSIAIFFAAVEITK